LSADTLVSNPLNPQTLNRFSYVRNNPLRYTDPTGHVECRTQAECQEMGTTPGGGFNIPKPKPNGDEKKGGGGGCETLASCSLGTGAGVTQDPFGHYYTSTNVICPAEYACTETEIKEYAKMFQYPGQNPWFSVKDGGYYFVAPAPQLAKYFGNPALLWFGAIQVDITKDGLTLYNYSFPTHIFHEGSVERTYEQREDGAWIVTTTGSGTNVWPIIGPTIDTVNDAVGEPVFTAVDTQMLVYIIIDKNVGGLP